MQSAFHATFDHWKRLDTDVRMLFLDFTAATITVIANRLVSKLHTVSLNTIICN